MEDLRTGSKFAKGQEKLRLMTTRESSHKNDRKTMAYFLCLVLCTTLLFLAGLDKRHLWNPDEPRVAGIAAEMARSGNMVVPMLNGQPFLEKPPLYFWGASIAFDLLGEKTYTARIPSAMAAIFGTALVFFLALSTGSSNLTPFLCGFILATSAEYWEIGRKSMIDMMLCLFITSAMACFFHFRRSLSKRILWYLGFILSLSCAVMTKGIVGLAIPVCALTAFLLLEKDFSFRDWGLLSLACALCLIPAAVWIWFLYNNLGRDAVYEVVWTNNFGRFTGSHDSHINPFYYYIINFPVLFLPWSLFLPIAMVHHIREIRKQNEEDHSLFFLCWLGIPFLLLSVSAAKRGIYMLPLYPAAALLVGTALGRFLGEGENTKKWFSVPTSILAWITILLPLVFCGITIYFKRPFLVCLLASFPGLCLGIWAYHRRINEDIRGFFKIVMAALVVLFLTFGITISQIFNQFKSYEPLFYSCEKLISEGAQISLFKPTEAQRGAAVFYLGRTFPVLEEKEDLKSFLCSAKSAAAIAQKNKVENLEYIDMFQSFNIGHRTIVLVRDKGTSLKDFHIQ